MPVLMCPRKKLWTGTYSTRDQVQPAPSSHVQNKVPFWILKEFAVTKLLEDKKKKKGKKKENKTKNINKKSSIFDTISFSQYILAHWVSG